MGAAGRGPRWAWAGGGEERRAARWEAARAPTAPIECARHLINSSPAPRPHPSIPIHHCARHCCPPARPHHTHTHTHSKEVPRKGNERATGDREGVQQGEGAATNRTGYRREHASNPPPVHHHGTTTGRSLAVHPRSWLGEGRKERKRYAVGGDRRAAGGVLRRCSPVISPPPAAPIGPGGRPLLGSRRALRVQPARRSLDAVVLTGGAVAFYATFPGLLKPET
ncbi:hypothetical protein BDA96_10G226600 [Sorghum bicolor]|uniref:Uncharacterized protein n=1 Tax=Sorghum bicolor TaxID=4558 RepID=A0A921U1S7_SORBI|nr:hypothetical protein BDA96_10G226600 [Sorghum bicolor]